MLCSWHVKGIWGLRPGEVWPSESHSSDNSHFQVLLPRLQEVFEQFVLAEKTGQLASPESCAYTDFAAASHRSHGVNQCDPAGTYAAARACLRRKSSLTAVISSESFIPLQAYFQLAHFWR